MGLEEEVQLRYLEGCLSLGGFWGGMLSRILVSWLLAPP